MYIEASVRSVYRLFEVFIEGLKANIVSSCKEVWFYSLSYVGTSLMCAGTALHLSMEGAVCYV